jgi:hypothetical protein
VIALLTDLKSVMVWALTARGVPAFLTFAIHIPITAVSAKLPFAWTGAYSRAFFIIIFDPVPAFIFFAKPFKDTLAALFTIDVIGVFNLIIRF